MRKGAHKAAVAAQSDWVHALDVITLRPTLALLKYTASKGYGRHNTLFGFELGNELQDDLPAAVLAAQYKKLAGYLRELWPDEAKRPWIIGVRL